jgi:ArsR family transcriptional regulator
MAEEIAKLGAALADETRVRILFALNHSPACVCELADALQIPQSTLSNHLAKLRRVGVVQTQREGTWIYYSLRRDSPVRDLLTIFEHIRENCPTVRSDRSRLEQRLAMRVNGKCATSSSAISNHLANGASQ